MSPHFFCYNSFVSTSLIHFRKTEKSSFEHLLLLLIPALVFLAAVALAFRMK